MFFFVVRPDEHGHGAAQARDEEPDAPSAEVSTLIEIRDLLAAQRGAGGRLAARHTRRVPEPTATLEELLSPLREDPSRSAVLLDVDGVLAPIVAHPDDAHMPETTRRPLIEVAKRYGVVACVSGRRASDARRIVSLGSIAYLGSHGSEVLQPGSIKPEMDRELQAWTRRVQDFAHDAFGDELRQLRVRLEDKEAIAALHWRGVPDEDDAEAAIREVADARREGRLHDPLGPQGARDPPARADRQGRRDRLAAARHRPRRRDLRRRRRHRPRRLPRARRARRAGPARHARSGSACAPTRARRSSREEADWMVEGTDGVRELLRALLG